MTIATLPIPECTMDDGIDKLGYAVDALNSRRYALAHLMNELRERADTGAYHVLDCVIFTLAQAAEDLKTGRDAVTFEHVWKSLDAHEAREAPKPA